MDAHLTDEGGREGGREGGSGSPMTKITDLVVLLLYEHKDCVTLVYV